MTSVQKYTAPKLRNPLKSNSTSHHSLLSAKTLQIPPSNSTSHKRLRPHSPLSTSKKSKTSSQPNWHLQISLLDEEFPISINFRCYYEDSIIPPAISETLTSSNTEDDDCRTEDTEIRFCSDYVTFQLEQAILKAEVNA